MPRQPDASASAVTLLYQRERRMGHLRMVRSISRTVTVLALGAYVGLTFVGGEGFGSWSTSVRLILTCGVVAWVVELVHEYRVASHQLNSRVLVARVSAVRTELAAAERGSGRPDPRRRPAP